MRLKIWPLNQTNIVKLYCSSQRKTTGSCFVYKSRLDHSHPGRLAHLASAMKNNSPAPQRGLRPPWGYTCAQGGHKTCVRKQSKWPAVRWGFSAEQIENQDKVLPGNRLRFKTRSVTRIKRFLGIQLSDFHTHVRTYMRCKKRNGEKEGKKCEKLGAGDVSGNRSFERKEHGYGCFLLTLTLNCYRVWQLRAFMHYCAKFKVASCMYVVASFLEDVARFFESYLGRKSLVQVVLLVESSVYNTALHPRAHKPYSHPKQYWE